MRFDILSRHLNVFEPHFLEASAGTGKTFAIEHLVTRLVIEGNSPLNLEQILVVTFTRAATRELKSRIRQNLEKTKEALSLGQPSNDYCLAIVEEGEAAIQKAIDRIDAALICYDSAQIYTLHGFCYRILQEFALEAGVNINLSDPEEKEYVSIAEKVVRNHLKESISIPEYSPFQLKAVLQRYRSNSRRLISELTALVSSGKEIASTPTHEQALNTFVHEIRTLPQIDAENLKSDLSLLITQYKEMTGEDIQKQIALLSEILEAKQCSIEQFDQLLENELFLKNMQSSNLKKRPKPFDLSSLHYPNLIEELQKSLLPPLELAKDTTRTFLRLTRDLQELSAEHLEAQEKFSPDALLIKVGEALESPQFQAKVRQKFRAAIIDEFQDTDPIQWKIFKELFISHIDAICLVGDPKQSIYAFRNADVYVYLDAAKAMGESAKKHLDTNFRSSPPLVEALNLLFSRAQGGWMDLPERQEPLEVIPVKAGRTSHCELSQAPIQFFATSGKKGRSKKFPTEEIFQKNIYPYIASEIHSLHTEKKVAYHDIAILIKDRFQGQALIHYLKTQGISAQTKRSASIIQSPAYGALKEILSAALFPYHLGKLKVALGGPLILFTEKELFNTDSSSCLGLTLLQAKAQMLALHHTLYESGFSLFFEQLLKSHFGNTSLSLLEKLLNQGDLSLYIDLRKLAEILMEEEALSGLKGEALLLYLEEIGTETAGDENRFKTFSGEEKGSVTIMTTHMSKGLEFDTVFALGLSCRHKTSDHIVIKKEGRSITTHLDPDDPLCERAIAEADAEKMRQLYVALTRAKNRLYIPLILEEECKGIPMGEASPIELFLAKMKEAPVSHASLYACASSLDLTSVEALLGPLSSLISLNVIQESFTFSEKLSLNEEITLEPFLPLCLPKWDAKIFSFTSLSQKNHGISKLISPDASLLSPHAFPLGSETGSLLHLLFEKIFKRRLHHPFNPDALSALIEEEITFSPLEKFKPIFLPWIEKLLKQPLTTFSLCDIPPHQLQQEVEFCYPLKEGMMKGFADLFFEFEGKYYLLDWKSNYLGPTDLDYSPEKIAAVMKEYQYDMQACIYADALKRYVKLFDMRPFSECFGGAIYYFVRGSYAFHFIPNEDFQ